AFWMTLPKVDLYSHWHSKSQEVAVGNLIMCITRRMLFALFGAVAILHGPSAWSQQLNLKVSPLPFVIEDTTVDVEADLTIRSITLNVTGVDLLSSATFRAKKVELQDAIAALIN